MITCIRLVAFFGLPYGNTDDITGDYYARTVGVWGQATSFASNQARIYLLVTEPVGALMMRLAGTVWYDLLNLSAFAFGSMLPLFALRRWLDDSARRLYVLAFFATLPLLFSYTPPYGYPTFMHLPLVSGGLAFLAFGRSRESARAVERERWLIAGSVLLMLSLLCYEPGALVIVLMLLAYFGGPGANRIRPRRRLAEVWCASVVVGLYLIAYLIYRTLHPPTYDGVQLSLGLGLPQMLTVLRTLSVSSNVFAWMVWPQPLSYVDFGSGRTTAMALFANVAWSRLEFAALPAIGVAIITLILAWRALRSGRRGESTVHLAFLSIAAVVLLFGPNVGYLICPKISSLVLKGNLVAYAGTAYSQMGFALSITVVGLWLRRLRPMGARVVGMLCVAGFIGWGSLAATGFNQASARVSRAQAAKWEVVRFINACSTKMPPEYLSEVVAPRLWNYSTGAMSWGEPRQEQRYWDVLSATRYGLQAHFVRSARKGGPVTFGDYQLDPSGALERVVLRRSDDGASIQETFQIERRDTSYGPGIRPCGADLQMEHFNGTEWPPLSTNFKVDASN